MNDSADARRDRAFVYAVVRRILRSDDDAADATQDALLLAHRYRDRFRGESAVRTWLYRIAVTTALGALRKARRSRERLSASHQPVGDDSLDHAPSPEHTVAAKQLAARAEHEIAQLGERYRRVLALKLEDWTEREIAAELRISVANVKIRTHRVRRHLHAALGDWGQPAARSASATPG